MALYIDAELITDETAVAEALLAGMADRINTALDLDEDEEWEPSEGSPETSLGEALGIVLATAASMTQEAERNDYAGFGENILGVFRTNAEPAIGYSKWTFSDLGDYVLPDGAEMTMISADGTPVAYAVVGDVNVVAATEATDVQVVAIEPGAISNGILGEATDWEPLPFVTLVEMTTAPTGGADAQTRDEYIEDVARRARRLKDVPIVTDDYADKALDHPSVNAAMAVRLLNAEAYPGPPATPGHVTIFTRDAAGVANSAGVKTEVAALMQGTDRPLGVTVHIGDPTETNLTVAVSIRLTTDADEPAVVASVQDAIGAAYNKATYAIDDDAPGRWRAPASTTDRTISRFDVAAVIDDLDGVSKVTDVTINGGTSVTLGGWAPLPNLTAPATVTVVP